MEFVTITRSKTLDKIIKHVSKSSTEILSNKCYQK